MEASAKRLGFELACSLRELQAAPGHKLVKRLETGRGVALWWRNGRVHCLDAACYHHGAPLVDGDIEDLNGTACVVCPWHKYKIALEDGQCLYVGLDISTGQSQLKSKGVKQRPHAVEVRDDGNVYVLDSGAACSSSSASRRGRSGSCAGPGADAAVSADASSSSAAATLTATIAVAAASACEKLPPAVSSALPSDEYAFKPFNSGQAPPGVHSSIGPGGVPTGFGFGSGAGGFPVGYAYGHAPLPLPLPAGGSVGPGGAAGPMSGSMSAGGAGRGGAGGPADAAAASEPAAPAKASSGGGGWTVSFPFGWRSKGGQ